jgi:hypothetical protein
MCVRVSSMMARPALHPKQLKPEERGMVQYGFRSKAKARPLELAAWLPSPSSRGKVEQCLRAMGLVEIGSNSMPQARAQANSLAVCTRT